MDVGALKAYARTLRAAHPQEQTFLQTLDQTFTAVHLADGDEVLGPCTRICRILTSIHWEWETIDSWTEIDSGNRYDLPDMTTADLEQMWHRIREAIRRRELQRAMAARMMGMDPEKKKKKRKEKQSMLSTTNFLTATAIVATGVGIYLAVRYPEKAKAVGEFLFPVRLDEE